MLPTPNLAVHGNGPYVPLMVCYIYLCLQYFISRVLIGFGTACKDAHFLCFGSVLAGPRDALHRCCRSKNKWCDFMSYILTLMVLYWLFFLIRDRLREQTNGVTCQCLHHSLTISRTGPMEVLMKWARLQSLIVTRQNHSSHKVMDSLVHPARCTHKGNLCLELLVSLARLILSLKTLTFYVLEHTKGKLNACYISVFHLFYLHVSRICWSG